MNDDALEMSLVGCAILDAQHTLDVCEKYGITKDSFRDPAWRRVFATVRVMHAEGAPVDLTTVSARLQLNGTLEKIGGSQRLESAVDASATVQHAATMPRV